MKKINLRKITCCSFTGGAACQACCARFIKGCAVFKEKAASAKVVIAEPFACFNQKTFCLAFFK
jgi:hypothetical protein